MNQLKNREARHMILRNGCRNIIYYLRHVRIPIDLRVYAPGETVKLKAIQIKKHESNERSELTGNVGYDQADE